MSPLSFNVTYVLRKAIIKLINKYCSYLVVDLFTLYIIKYLFIYNVLTIISNSEHVWSTGGVFLVGISRKKYSRSSQKANHLKTADKASAMQLLSWLPQSHGAYCLHVAQCRVRCRSAWLVEAALLKAPSNSTRSTFFCKAHTE